MAGDFRWSRDLLRTSPTYRSLMGAPRQQAHQMSNAYGEVQRDVTVYLDTTYCHPTHNFPPQDVAINAVLECVRRYVHTCIHVFFYSFLCVVEVCS